MNAISKAIAPAFVIASLALGAQAAVPETVGVLLLRLQEDSAVPLIQHCVARIPALERSLDLEYARFRKKFRKATAPLRARIGANPELAKPAPRELINQFAAVDAQMLEQVRKLDPQTYCARLKENLSNATPESIRKNMESAFAQYTAAARHSR